MINPKQTTKPGTGHGDVGLVAALDLWGLHPLLNARLAHPEVFRVPGDRHLASSGERDDAISEHFRKRA